MKAIARAPFFAPFPLSAVLVMGVLTSLSGCAPSAPVAPPKPTAAPVARPAPRPAPAPRPVDWRDLPLTPGVWRWSLASGVSQAEYGLAGGSPQIIMECRNGQVRLIVPGQAAPGSVIAVTTSTQTRQASTESDPAGTALTLQARDNLLDAIAFTRGRWQVEMSAHTPLLLPADPSASRVVEDCRALR